MGLKTQNKTVRKEDRHSQRTDTDTQEGTQTEIHTGKRQSVRATN